MSGTSGHDNNLQERPTQTYEGRNYPIEFNIRKLPDRWLKYDPVHRDIPETRLVAFKTPLKASFFNGLPDDHEDRFEVETLLKYAKQGGKTMGLVVDLTNTNRYYESKLWSDNGVQYEKIRCPGHEVHDQEPLFQQFMTVLRNFFRDNANNDKIVGVHCTHGVNRTGYMICRYLITDHGWTTERAVEAFSRYRRHRIERPPYIAALRDAERRLKGSNGICGPTRSRVSTPAYSGESVAVPKEEPKRQEPKREKPAEETIVQSELLYCMPAESAKPSMSASKECSPNPAKVPRREESPNSSMDATLSEQVPEAEGITVNGQ